MTHEGINSQLGLSRLAQIAASLRQRFDRGGAERGPDGRLRRSDATTPDVVSVGSIVRVFDLEALREFTLIVAPDGRSGAEPDFVSAETAMVAALLGRREGEVFEFGPPSARRRLKVVEIKGRLGAQAWEPVADHQPAPRSAAGARLDATREAEVAPTPEALPTAA
jgi:transcription elongation GreA/GreB family factor